MSIGSGEDAPAAMAHAPPMQAVGIHGLVGQFDPRQEEWCDYIETLIHYFVANDIAEEAKKRAILLTAVGPGTYRLLKTLASPRRLDELRFSELVDLATRQYNPKPSPIVKRFEFNSRSQKEGESIAVFVAQLRKIAEHCDYGAVLSDMFRDRLVCGTSNKGIQRRLLLQADLTFDRAMEIALAAEAAEKDLERLMGDEDPTKLPQKDRLLHRYLCTLSVGNVISETILQGAVVRVAQQLGNLGATGVVGATNPLAVPARTMFVTTVKRRDT